jgi:uncharacterized membrane-anchored protein
MTLNLGYLVGTAIFGVVLVAAAATQIAAKRFHPLLYWAAIVATTIVGTTLADLVLIAFIFTRVSRTILFWTAFLLTRPLGATVGDFLDKPIDHGGLAFGRFTASAVLAVFMLACILFLPQRAARYPIPDVAPHL